MSAKRPATSAEIEQLLEQAKHLINKTKRAKNAEKKKCKTCNQAKKIYVAGQCEECYLDGRKVREEAKLGKRWFSTNGLEYTYVEADGVTKVALYARVRMSELLGRPLHPYEIVSHKDGDKRNNEDDNLYLSFKTGFDLSTLVCSCGRSYIEEMKAAASLKEENSAKTSLESIAFTLNVTPSLRSDK